MKGSPLMRALVLLGILGLLGWPLHWLTRLPEVAALSEGIAPNGPEAPGPITVELTFSRPALKLEISHLGKVIWVRESPAENERVALTLPFPKEGVELGVRIEWQGGALGALRMQLETPEGTQLERSVWGAGTVETVVAFP